jgi:hypothetical protein
VIRASVLALVFVANLLAQGPAPEKYRPTKLEKITSYPEVPVYVYLVAVDLACTMNTRLNAKEGSEIKFASDPPDYYLMDSDGKTYKCKFVVFGAPPPPLPQSKNK